MATSEYDSYILSEWEHFSSDPTRARALLDAIAGLDVARVLDVGCGAGQELSPFVSSKEALGVGIDLAPEVGQLGRQLYAEHAPGSRVVFVRGAAEGLPFGFGCFDVVICRLALPYTDNGCTLAEIARVLRPDGILVLKIHHMRYYMSKFWQALLTRNLLSMVHAGRVLAAGMIYHLSGKQVRSNLISAETFQTEWLLRRELAREGLVIWRQMPDSNPITPSFIIRKK